MFKSIINYLVQDLRIKPDIAVSIILTLLTFSLGFIITWVARGLAIYIKRMNYKRALKIIIRKFLKDCETQYKLLEKVSSQRGFLHGENYNIPLKSNFGQKYLSTLDVKTFIENFSSIFLRDRSKQITELFEIVESCQSSKELCKQQINIYFQTFQQQISKYNSSIDNLRRLQDELELGFKEINDPELKDYALSINKTFTNWKDKGADNKIHSTSTEIVNPLFEKAISISPNIISRKVIDDCIQCRAAVQDISNVELNIKDEVHNLMEVYKASYFTGNQILNEWTLTLWQRLLKKIRNKFKNE